MMKRTDGNKSNYKNPCRTVLVFCQFQVNEKVTGGHTLRLYFTFYVRKHEAKFGKEELKSKITEEQTLALLNKFKQLLTNQKISRIFQRNCFNL